MAQHWQRLREGLHRLRSADPDASDEEQRQLWRERRLRMALRRYGPIKSEVLASEVKERAASEGGESIDEVDGILRDAGEKLRAEIISAKRSLFSLAKEALQSRRRRRSYAPQQHPPSKSFPLHVSAGSSSSSSESATASEALDSLDRSAQLPSPHRIPAVVLRDVTDNSDRRRFGVGRLGRLLQSYQEPSVVRQPHVRYQLDDLTDHRPYFSYWVTAVQGKKETDGAEISGHSSSDRNSGFVDCLHLV